MGAAMTNDYGVQLDRNGYAPTIMQKAERCYMCARSGILQRHEIYGSANRDKSKAFGLWIWLCPECHDAVHFKHAELKLELREQGQITAQRYYGWNDNEFRQMFGKCYK